MARKKLNTTAVAYDEVRLNVVRLYTQGYSMREIQRKIPSPRPRAANAKSEPRVALSTIHGYINAAIVEWRAAKAELISDYKAEELAKLNRLEATYWEGWEKSSKGKADGDHSFLDGIRHVIALRCRILGDAPMPAVAMQVINNGDNAQTVLKTVQNRTIVFDTVVTTASPQIIVEDEQ